MARDRGRRGYDASGPDASPVDQLETWRTWRHDDTAELPVVPATYDDGHAGYATEELADPAARRRRRRPGTGLLVGAGLLLAALAVSGLAAAGVGPVAHLLGSGDGNDRPSGTTGTSSPTGSRSSSTAGGTSSSGSAGGSTGSTGSTTPGGAAAPTAAPAPRGAVPTDTAPTGTAPTGTAPTGAGPDPAGSAAPGPGGHGPGAAGGRHGTPPQPPAGGPGA